MSRSATPSADRPWGFPHPTVSIGALVAYLIALYPGTLPRATMTTAILTGVLVAIGTTIGMALARRRLRPPDPQTVRVVGGAALVVAAISSAMALWWQSVLRAAVGAPPPGLGWCAAAILVPALVVTAIVALPRTSALVAASAAAVVAGLVSPTPAAGDEHAPAAAASAHGRGQELPTLLRGRLEATDFAAAATEVTERWVRSGGRTARAVVVAVPTGSGWVDPAAVKGFTRRFDGNVRVVALPYADVPSWQAFVADTSPAERSAIALVRELAAVLTVDSATESSGTRPQLVLYGQSLGAIGADAAREWLDDHHPGLLSRTVLVAPPAGTVADSAASPRVVRSNASDPVARWSPTALWWPPSDPADTHRRGPRIPEAPWLPVVSFLQTSVDLLGALDGPAGVGHRYGTDQVVDPLD